MPWRHGMHLLYLDESGAHSASENLVVGGVAIFERATYWLKQDLEAVAKKYFGDQHIEVEIHASKLRVPEGADVAEPYNRISGTGRRAMLSECYDALARSPHTNLFATVVRKSGIGDRDPYEVAFEDLVSRFDLMLARLHAMGDTQRGLVIVAESSYRDRLETLGDRILREGTQWSQTHNLTDIPFFTPASRTRLLQVADLVTNAVWGNYEKGLARDFQHLLPRFNREGERLHGLTHIGVRALDCWCPACYSWRVHR